VDCAPASSARWRSFAYSTAELRRAFPNARIRHDNRCWRGRTVVLHRNHWRKHALTGIDDTAGGLFSSEWIRITGKLGPEALLSFAGEREHLEH